MFVKLGTVTVDHVLNQDSFNARRADRRIVEYDPDYVYVVVRALTADKPNSNGDCFPHEELIRLDAVLQRPVYASFIGKGVYINHQHTDDPRYAKGIILDSRYVQGNADDKYVELLLGVDKQKDPVFARDVERGLINKFSMGASVQFTKCSVCSNEARRKEEFCEHIAKHKMREVKAEDGSKKLAYELCYGVTYNELSAVADPADETAQTLARIAKRGLNGDTEGNTANPSHGTVVVLNEMNARLKRLEAAIMANRRTAAPAPPVAAGPPADPAGLPGADPMGGDDMAMEETPGEAGPVVEVLQIVEDLLTGRVPAADAVQALEQVAGGGQTAPEAAPGAEMGAPEPDAMDMGGPGAPTASSVSKWLKRMSKTLKKERPNVMATRKTAEEGSPKVENQYPYKKRQSDPKQFPNPAHDSRHESRPASDFDSDSAEYTKKYINLSAEFVPNADKRLAGWRIVDGETPLYMITGARAWEDQLDAQWHRFADRSYGETLVAAILEDGLEPTMERVKAIKAGGSQNVQAASTEHVLDNGKLLQAAEAKANDIAAELHEDFVVRLIEGMKLALKLQDKNVYDNILKGAAYEVLSASGADPRLAEKIVTGAVVEAHFDEALKKALEYTEMTPESFEEVKAQAETMISRSVTAAASASDTEPVSEAEAMAAMESTARESMRRRASRGSVKSLAPGETPAKGFDQDVTRAVRAGSTVAAPPSKPLTFGKPQHAA